ncbi:SRPBCC family protein [Mycobacterium sp. 050128]|uniref:SRPBCC family protein n=1 Tax=unclassified Mycobacterium TaxID=2642494 RepID=UPI002ED8ABF5
MSSSKVEPIRKSVAVNTGIERAFTLFISKFDAIKPREHNLLSVPIAETVFEPRVGGHIYDVGTDGSRCEWARVLVYEAPFRVVFSWDISPTWQLEADPAKTSEVEVRFIAESEDRTRVELEHRHLERHGTGWQAVADGVDGDAGWPLYLSHYVEIAKREESL